MAYDPNLVERVRQRLSGYNITAEKKMMGGLLFMVNDKMCIGVDKVKATGEDRLMVRVGKTLHDELVCTRGSSEMNFTGRPMRGYLFISPEGFDNAADLDFWIAHAIEFNKQLTC